ncbi:uncharacterized protein LOC126709669 isoform X2 [Quercus robur]|nr:uncharacterized protein LOC126709669 isoform X2 [Quercus robur]
MHIVFVFYVYMCIGALLEGSAVLNLPLFYLEVFIDRLHMSSLVNAFVKNLMDAGLIISWILSEIALEESSQFKDPFFALEIAVYQQDTDGDCFCLAKDGRSCEG